MILHQRALFSVALAAAVLLAWVAPARAWLPGGDGPLAFAAAGGSSAGIWTVQADGSREVQLTSPPAGASDGYPAWSPDGFHLAFSEYSPLPAGPGCDPSRCFAGHIFTMAADGGGRSQLTSVERLPDGSTIGDAFPAWSPDGTRIAFVRDTLANGVIVDSHLMVMNTDGSGVRDYGNPAGAGRSVVGRLAWSPAGGQIAFVSFPTAGSGPGSTLAAVQADTGAVSALGSPVGNSADPDWSPLGIVFGNSPAPALQAISVGDGTAAAPRLTPIALAGSTRPPEPVWAPALGSPPRVAYMRDDPSGTGSQLFIGAIDGTGAHQLTFDATWKANPSWSPVIGQRVPPTFISRPPPFFIDPGRIRARVTCPADAGARGCVQDVIALLHAHELGAASVHLAAGESALALLHLTSHGRRLLAFARHVRIRVTSLLAGGGRRTTTTRVRVELPATLTESCTTGVRLGAGVAVAGSLSASGRGVGASAAGPATGAGQRIGLLAISPFGRTVFVSTVTGPDRSYHASFVPSEPGVWLVQSVWGGDPRHVSTPSPKCAVQVAPELVAPSPPTFQPGPPPPSPPPPASSAQAESLSLNCPGKATQNMPFAVNGTLSPPVAGAQVKVTYTPPSGAKESPTSHTAATDSGGSYSDSFTPDLKGNWTVQAQYAGDSSHQGATSAACPVTVE